MLKYPYCIQKEAEETRRIGVVWLCIFMAFNGAIVGSNSMEETDDEQIKELEPLFIPHSPIIINSNADFDAAHGVTGGNGTKGNPWVIENYDINGGGSGHCIEILFTTDYFIIKNCFLHDSTGASNCGIRLYSVINGIIDNNTISNNHWGVYLPYSNNITITNNTLELNDSEGILLYESSGNIISYNDIFECNYGISMGRFGDDSEFNYIKGNNVTLNLNWGINVGSNLNTVSENFVSENDNGILVSGDDNVLVSNTIISNLYTGVEIENSDNNIFVNNSVISNIRLGLFFDRSTLCILYQNKMFSNGIFINGNQIEHWNTHIIPLNNTVNDKPTYFWVNKTSDSVPLDAGQIILVNCSDVIIKNQELNYGDCGIQIAYSSRINVTNSTMVSNRKGGIYISDSDNITLNNNQIHLNEYEGLILMRSTDCNITNNSIIQNMYGISLASFSENNIVTNNFISSNRMYGFSTSCNSNIIYHNTFWYNFDQVRDIGTNTWDNSYPSGGNYWSDYTGVDLNSTPTQDVPPPDGIGDTPYIINFSPPNADYYPLMYPFGSETSEQSLNEGWNLISLPLNQIDESIDKVISPIDGKWDCIQAYDAINEIWLSNVTNRPDSLNDLDSLDHKMGFWINVTEPNVNLTVSGPIPASTSINLYAGWNLVGYPSLVNETVANALWGTGADKVEVCDPAEPYRIREVGPSYVMRPGEGYWVHVPADSVWVLDW